MSHSRPEYPHGLRLLSSEPWCFPLLVDVDCVLLCRMTLPSLCFTQERARGVRRGTHTAYSTPTALPASSDVPPDVRAVHAQGGESDTRSQAHPPPRPAQSSAFVSA